GYGLKMRGTAKKERREPVAKQLEVMGLTGFEKAYPAELSGGMQQRVAIARALVLEPPILLMDEPFGALDAQTRTGMQDEMGRLRSSLNSTVILITHSVEEAVYLGDRVLAMSARPGQIKRELSISADEPWKQVSIEKAQGDREFNRLREEVWQELHSAHTES